MKAFLIFSLMVIVVPLSFFSPFAGLLSYLAVAYLRPHEWAYMPESRISLAVASATFLGYLLFDMARRLPRLVPNLVLVMLWVQLAFSTALAYNVPIAQTKLVEFTKVILIALLMTALADSEQRIRQLYVGTMLVMGGLVIRSFARIIYSGGADRAYGPGGAFEDNNDYALLLVMVLPMLYYAFKGEPVRWLKWVLGAFTFMTFTTIFFTRSRGGFVGMCVVMVALGLRTKYKVTGLIIAPLLIVVMLAFAPSVVTERIGTIQGASETDASAQQRLRVWALSWRVMSDHPLTGVGLRNLMMVYGRYADEADARVAHNSYLQMGSEAGFPAMLLLIALIVVSYFRMWRARSLLRARAPNSPLINYSHGLQVALIGYSVSGFFVSRHDLEMLYEVCALATTIRLIAQRYENEARLRDEVERVTSPEFVGLPVSA